MSGRYLVRRFAYMLLTIWIAVTLVFVLFHLLPGDPASALVDPLSPPATREALAHQLGLDRPIWVQYGLYWVSLAHGSLGISFQQHVPVLQLIKHDFFNTFLLALLTFLLAYAVGAALGVWFAYRRGHASEQVGSAIALLLRGAPTFWLGVVAIIVFSVHLGWLPVSGLTSSTGPVTWRTYLSLDFVRHLLLPVLSSTLYAIGLPLLLMRNTMLEVMDEEFVRLSRAKGLTERAVMLRHAARNALLPLVAESAQFLGWAVGGLVTIEYVFSWPGLARELVTALEARDFPLAQGAFLAVALMVVLLNFLADAVSLGLDPRISLERA